MLVARSGVSRSYLTLGPFFWFKSEFLVLFVNKTKTKQILSKQSGWDSPRVKRLKMMSVCQKKEFTHIKIRFWFVSNFASNSFNTKFASDLAIVDYSYGLCKEKMRLPLDHCFWDFRHQELFYNIAALLLFKPVITHYNVNREHFFKDFHVLFPTFFNESPLISW